MGNRMQWQGIERMVTGTMQRPLNSWAIFRLKESAEVDASAHYTLVKKLETEKGTQLSTLHVKNPLSKTIGAKCIS